MRLENSQWRIFLQKLEQRFILSISLSSSNDTCQILKAITPLTVATKHVL